MFENVVIQMMFNFAPQKQKLLPLKYKEVLKKIKSSLDGLYRTMYTKAMS